MSDSPDANLQLKKRARRRLVGAIAFAGLAAVVLPMIMDEEPKQQIQDIQIRIPGQDQTPFNPKVGKPATSPASSDRSAASGKTETVPAPPVPNTAKTVEAPPLNKAGDKPPEPAGKAAAKEPLQAAAGSAGKTEDVVLSAIAKSTGGQYIILIGAFSNPANVKQLQTKIGELGVKVFTEPLDSPGGKKTRVRAGPFDSREAADKALDKMKRIGVNGVIAAKQ
ncbi:MAG: SPOR domain-containing protein [Propionivibrio sp.]|nr:SPOR domain-containing protein [Propionivibrio sp.]